jgi:uncharacterized protein (TIGR00730 family)
VNLSDHARRDPEPYLVAPKSRLDDTVSAFKMLGEYLHGAQSLHDLWPCVTVFGSARLGEGHSSYELGREVGGALAHEGYTVLTGAGPGLMEAANRGAREAGGRSAGCNVHLPVEQQPNPYVDRVVTFHHFFVRKVMLLKNSVGFVALPGGYGTFDEVFEAANLIETGTIVRFPVVLLGSTFWEPVFDVLRGGLLPAGTIGEPELEEFLVTDDPEEAVAHIVHQSGNHTRSRRS